MWKSNNICKNCDNTICATCKGSAIACLIKCNDGCKTCNIDGKCLYC